jgi:hypothetical protein
VTHFLGSIAFLLLFMSCEQTGSWSDGDGSSRGGGFQKKSNDPTQGYFTALMDALNIEMANQGLSYRVGIAEYITGGDGYQMGATVLSKVVGNKQLGHDFIPFDARRNDWSGDPGPGPDNITYAIDQTGDAVPVFGGLTSIQTTAAIERAMGTWDAVTCSNLPLTRNASGAIDIGVVAFLNGLAAVR